MNFSNQVVDNNSNPNFSKENGGETKHQGIEMSLGYDIGAGFAIAGNVTYIPVSEFVGDRLDVGIEDGNRISYSPEVLANLELTYQKGALQTALAVHHSSAQYADSANTKNIPSNAAGGIWGGELDAYTVVDVHAAYDLNKQLKVFGSVKNLTDEKYIAGLRQGIYAGPDRSFEVGAKYQF